MISTGISIPNSRTCSTSKVKIVLLNDEEGRVVETGACVCGGGGGDEK